MENNKVVKIKEEIEMAQNLLKLELENEEQNEILINALQQKIERMQWCLDNQNSDFEVWCEKIKAESGVFEYTPSEYRTIRNLMELYINGCDDVYRGLNTKERIAVRSIVKLAEKEIMEKLELHEKNIERIMKEC